MTTLPESIRIHARSLTEGGVLSPKEFLHLGSRAAIDQALSRLAKSGELLRVARGMYVAPVTSRFGTRSPSPERVVRAFAEKSGEIVVSHGANSANALGLTQQVPTREIFLSSGRSRKLNLGRSVVTIRHAPQWMLALGSGPAGEAVRALAWMGQAHVTKSLGALHRRLSEADWNTLTSARAVLPSWMAKAIGQESLRG